MCRKIVARLAGGYRKNISPSWIGESDTAGGEMSKRHSGARSGGFVNDSDTINDRVTDDALIAREFGAARPLRSGSARFRCGGKGPPRAERKRGGRGDRGRWGPRRGAGQSLRRTKHG